MRILVTGATGHVGNCLVRKLSEQGLEVVSLSKDTGSPISKELGLEHIQCDVRDFEKVRSVLKQIDVVYHLAAKIAIDNSESERVWDINVNGARNVAQAAYENGIQRMVHVSSVHAFNLDAKDKPISEKTAYETRSSACIYDRSKAAGEIEVKRWTEKGLNAVIINPTGVIGPYDFGTSFMGKTLLSMYRGELPYCLNGGFNWIDVRDIADVLIDAKEKGESGANYIIGGHWYSICQLSQLISKVSGIPAARFSIPMPVAKMAARLYCSWNQWAERKVRFTPYAIHTLGSNRHVDYTKALKTFGYTPLPILQTLADLHEWWKQLKWIDR